MLEIDLNKLRKDWEIGDDQRDQGLSKHPEGVIRYDDLAYGEDGTNNLFDIYLPDTDQKIFPLIVNIHGGGYFYGDKERYQYYCLSLAKKSFGVVNFNYHLAPENPYPAALNDVDQMMHWLADHGEDYKLDTDKICLTADSAGAQLAEQYMTIMINDDFRKLFAYTKANVHIVAAALNSGLYFLQNQGTISNELTAYFGNNALEKWGEQLATEKYITKDFPPVYLATAIDDFLKNKAIELNDFLKKNGNDTQLHIFGDRNHSEGHVFHLNLRDNLAQKCNDEEIAFFKKQLLK